MKGSDLVEDGLDIGMKTWDSPDPEIEGERFMRQVGQLALADAPRQQIEMSNTAGIEVAKQVYWQHDSQSFVR